MIKRLFCSIVALLVLISSANAKKVLDHTSFDSWKALQMLKMSNSGEWASWVVNPQEGDGVLTIRNVKTGKEINIPRGTAQVFSADSKWVVARIKPLYQATRQAKIKKKKGLELPQDSLVIVNLATGKIEKFPGLQSFSMGKNGSEWVAWTTVDTAYIKPKALKQKDTGKPLVIRNLASGKTKVVNWVDKFNVSPDGMKVAVVIKPSKKDTTAVSGIGVVTLPDTAFYLIDREKQFYGAPVFNPKSSLMAFTLSNDSNKTGTKRAELYFVDMAAPMNKPVRLSDAGLKRAMTVAGNGEGLYFNQYTKPEFTEDGKHLKAGVAKEIVPDDTTIVDFEVAGLDIWRWDAPMTPPQENLAKESLRKYTFPVVFDLETKQGMLLADDNLTDVRIAKSETFPRYALASKAVNPIERQWNNAPATDITLIDLQSGNSKKALTVPGGMAFLSDSGNYIVWYDDRNYHSYNIATGETVNLTEMMEYPIWDESQDRPGARSFYGFALIENEDAILIYDKHDIFRVDLSGKTAPVNITAGDGRANNRRYRNIYTDPEKRKVKAGETLLLSVFNYGDKKNGLATLALGKPSAPVIRTVEPYQFTRIVKAKDKNVYVFQKANFNTSPDVYLVSGYDFANAKKSSDINPQMKDYNWGTAELVKWNAYNGEPTEGVLYKPEDFDPSKKYPMLVVFYETNSENLYKYYNMEPSWSWVNYPFYVSRGYVILVPDVHYAYGIPGESAYNYICSGVEELCKRYEWIDKDHIGIDGQSWGGYQTAFLVTRTNMFACAGSGAPVANMTSAFGGIRWESGGSRQVQYERGQSRIGRNLWEAPELYIANSPVFYADRVETPLLIMHNDNDGAVPWYQGIEMFMALRRLQKPVWMLQYNGEAHNIRQRRNRKDITIRLQQFFDHYLKGAPMPKWMKEGIPVVRKGQEWGTELIIEK